MKKTILICDKCGKETITNDEYKEKYRGIEIKTSNSAYYTRYLLCPECQLKLGIIEDINKLPKPVPDIKDRLFEIIEEIVQMNIDNKL